MVRGRGLSGGVSRLTGTQRARIPHYALTATWG